MLRRSEAQMLEQLFKARSDQDGRMNLCQFLLLAMERSLVSSRFGLKVFREIFLQASDHKEFITTNQFGSIIMLVSTTMFKNDPAPNERLLTYILSSNSGTIDLTASEETAAQGTANVPADLVELLSGPALEVLLEFEPFTRSLFVKYLPENLNKPRSKAVTWKEIEEGDHRLPLLCFLRILLAKYLIPEYLEAESIQEIIKQTIPVHTPPEDKFYQEGKFILAAEDPNLLKSPYASADGEPRLSYHEFQLVLGRAGLALPGEKKLDSAGRLREFLVEKLGFVKSKEPAGSRSVSPSPSPSPDRGEGVGEAELGEFDDDLIESDECKSESDVDDPYRKMELLQQRREEAMKRYQIDLNYEEIEKELNDLPPVPPPPEMKPGEMPKKETIKVSQLGRVKERKKKKEEKKQPKIKVTVKKPTLRRGEAPPKPIKYAGKPVPYPDATLQAVRSYIKDSIAPVIQQSTKARIGTSSVAACIIKEVYFPPDAPIAVSTLIESANVYLTNEEYELAVSTYEEARELWRKELAGTPFKVEYDLFFELSIANVLESSGQDEIALAKYISAKNVCAKGLPSHHPDVAIPFCGIASVMYNLEEFTLALRANLKAKEIREECLGGNTVDTATTYNNLGCCMMALGRYQEAKAYFMLGHAILQMELGPTHERVLTAFQNLEKIKRMPLVPPPEFHNPWNIFVLDKCPVKKRGKKKKGKRRK